MVGCCSLTVLPVPLWGGFGKPASRRRGISRNPSAAPLKHFRDPIFFCWCAISSVHPWGDPKPEKMPGFARPSMRDGSPQAKPSPEVSALHPWGTAGSPETPCNLLQRSGGGVRCWEPSRTICHLPPCCPSKTCSISRPSNPQPAVRRALYGRPRRSQR